MCLAIGHKDPVNRGVVSSAWWFIACSPLRLYSFSALFHSLILLLLSIGGLLNSASATMYVLAVVLVFGMLGWVALGLILEMFPRWYRTSVSDYSVFGLSHNLAFIALLLLELSMVKLGIWLPGGLILLVLAWLITLRNIRWIYLWGMGMKTPLLRAVKWQLNSLFMALLIITVLIQFDGVILGPLLWLSLLITAALFVSLMVVYRSQLQHH